MKTLKITESSTLNLDELIDLLENNGNKTIVYYRSSNKPDGEPKFLTFSKASKLNLQYQQQNTFKQLTQFIYGFKGLTFVDTTLTYSNTDLKECLKEVSKNRKIFILYKDELKELILNSEI